MVYQEISKELSLHQVQADSPANKAGIRGFYSSVESSGSKVGDIITAINRKPVKRIYDIIDYIESKTKAGESVRLTINRNAKIINLDVPLQSRPANVQKIRLISIRTRTSLSAIITRFIKWSAWRSLQGMYKSIGKAAFAIRRSIKK